MCQTIKVWNAKGKRKKPTSRKSAADAIGWDLAASGPNGSPHLGTLRHWIHNPIEVTEAVCQIPQRLMNVDPAIVSQKRHSAVRLGCKSRARCPKMHPKWTYTVILGCETGASVPKLHPNLIEASEKEEIVVSWQGDGRIFD